MDAVISAKRERSRQATGPPHHLTSFVGRQPELRSLKEALREARLVTITGTGGAGKTRLAAELLTTMSDRWSGGAWWIELAGSESVGGALIAALQLPGRGEAVDVVSAWLAGREALLVLDNCEHLIADCASFGQALLDRCPELKILATSREPLGVPGEVRWSLSPLVEADAVQLFEIRARLVSPTFKATPQADVVARICARLDRLPLAIEMASARLDLMSATELLENLNHRFQVLASASRTGPERQQTMTAAIDWSHRLLTADEARLFRRLAVFQGGFTMDSAQTVCAEGDAPVMPLLGALVKKSMVVADRLADERTRFRLLESHHDFAREKLRRSAESDEVAQRHHDYFSSRKWEPAEASNFWHAVAWARHHSADGGLGLALEIGDADFGDQGRAKDLILELLDGLDVDDVLRARALAMATRLAWRQSDLAATRQLAEAAVAAARQVGDPELIARALNGAGIAYEGTGELARASQTYDEALSLLDDSSNRRLLADMADARAALAIEQGDSSRAVEILLGTCIAFARSANDRPLEAIYIETLANAQLDLGDVDAAAASWTEALTVFRGVRDWFGIIWALGGLALVAAARHEDGRALRLAAAADRLSREYSLGQWRYREAHFAAAFEKARARLGSKARADSAWNEGLTMNTEETLDYALSGGPSSEVHVVDAGPLSRREREVVVLVAAGMTNKEIAQRLFISERTAEGHVERIRNKLEVRSRAEVAAWATAHGLIKQPLDKPPSASKV